jgi:hypothetical protein
VKEWTWGRPTARVGDPLLEPGVVALVGSQQGREGADQVGQGGHLGACAFEPGERLLLAACEADRPGEQEPRRPAGWQVRPVSLGAALVDVADEQVGAALVAELADLPQQLLDRDRGVLGATVAALIAAGVVRGRRDRGSNAASPSAR